MSTRTEWPRVGIIILNYKRPDHTTACLTSLRGLEYPAFETVVVDQGAPEGTPALIRARFPEVHLIENDTNLGFAGGNNVGAHFLLARGVDYVFLLNDDTEVAPDMLTRLVEAAEADPSIGMLGPKIYYYDHQDTIWFAGGAVDRYGQANHPGADQVDRASDGGVRDVDYATGCALLVKRAVIDRVGLLDERFFIYFEETEWCARARRAGYRVAYVPAARMWHKIKMGERNYSRRYLYLMTRNRLLFLRLKGASPWIIAMATMTLLRTALSWAVRPRHRELRPFAGALLEGIRDFAVGRFGAPPAHLLAAQ